MAAPLYYNGRRTNWDEVSVGDGSLDVEPVLNLVQLVVLAVERRRHLASSSCPQYRLVRMLTRVTTYTSSVLDGILELTQAVRPVVRRRYSCLREPLVRRKCLEEVDNRLVERDGLHRRNQRTTL